METVNQRSPGPELADVFRACGNEFASALHLSACQQKAFAAVLACRTSAMGSHTLLCDQCDHHKICYNSCRNRHCPKCQYARQLVWVEKLKARLLPVRYFHLVFTIPESLRPLFYLNQKICYELLFASSALAVKKAALNPDFLGVETGSLSVLHTWGQALTYHPHIHMLVPAGGLDPDHMQWIHAHRKFFVPVKALASIYRGLFISGLTKLLSQNSLRIPDSKTDSYTHPDQLKRVLYANNWHVYIKKTFRGANQVISYLGRYTHRVAISNSRIVSCHDDRVSFRWKDYRDNKQKTMILPVREFTTRFLRHILPDNFYKIRYYGIMASCGGTSKMDRCLELLGKPQIRSPLEGLTTYQILEKILGSQVFICPCCQKGRMVHDPSLKKIKAPE
jgi:hypothetical protein